MAHHPVLHTTHSLHTRSTHTPTFTHIHAQPCNCVPPSIHPYLRPMGMSNTNPFLHNVSDPFLRTALSQVWLDTLSQEVGFKPQKHPPPFLSLPGRYAPCTPFANDHTTEHTIGTESPTAYSVHHEPWLLNPSSTLISKNATSSQQCE